MQEHRYLQLQRRADCTPTCKCENQTSSEPSQLFRSKVYTKPLPDLTSLFRLFFIPMFTPSRPRFWHSQLPTVSSLKPTALLCKIIICCVEMLLTSLSSRRPITQHPGGPVDKVIKAAGKRLKATDDQILLAWTKAKGAVVLTYVAVHEHVLMETYLFI